MPHIKSNFGSHKDVNIVEFGTGDIEMTKVKIGDFLALVFADGADGDIGRISNNHKGKSSDDIPNVKSLLVFKKIESIDALIDTLRELKTEFEEPYKRDPNTKFTFYKVEYEDVSGVEYDYTICPDIEDIEQNIRVVDTDLDDDERESKVIISGIAMTDNEYEQWVKENEE